jgi:predicted  nucleic acid-binding Zn-ribbon protein
MTTTRHLNEKQLEYYDDKIISIEKRELSWRAIDNYRNKLSGKIAANYRKVQELEDEITKLKEHTDDQLYEFIIDEIKNASQSSICLKDDQFPRIAERLSSNTVRWVPLEMGLARESDTT